MERSKYLIAIILLVFCSLLCKASYKTIVYKAYISNNMDLWKRVIDEMSQTKTYHPTVRLELLNYLYGYSAWCLGNNKGKQAEVYIDEGERNIGILEKAGHNPSLVNAYKSAFYGFRIGLNKFRAPFWGPKSVDCAKLSIKQDPNNPYGYIQFGNSEYYKPAIMGGSKTVALEYFKKAEKLMESTPNLIKNDWNYLNLLVAIAKAYTEINEPAKAKAYYEKILKLEPDFLWVKNVLYPDLLKRYN